MSEQLLVVLGDVVASKEIPNRGEFRADLEAVLKEVNGEYAESIYAPFRVLKGVDEIGGVLSGFWDLYQVLRTICLVVHPTRIRFACAYGTVDVGIDGRDVSTMDGPAFHEVDRILAEVETERRLFRMDTTVGAPTVFGLNEGVWFDTLVGNQIELLFTWMHEWTEKEVEIIRRYEELDTQTGVAEALDISQQRVSNVVQTTNWHVVKGIESDLNDLLEVASGRLEDTDGSA